MLGKLKDLSNKYFKFSTANIQSYESVDREMNRELFYTIEVLDEAISKGLQVKFFYNEYGTDKKLHHRKNEDGDVREYIINPYTMVANGGKYYLICNYDKFDNLSHYRIDRISNIEILETPRKPKNQVEGLVGLDVAKYMQEHIFMFGGKSIRAKFEMPSYLISDVLDAFRANVDFKDLGDEMVLASVKVNENDMRFWARQYASQIKITEPKELVDMCKQDLENALALYQEL